MYVLNLYTDMLTHSCSNKQLNSMMISLPLFPLVVKRSSEVILNFQMVWDDWLKWVPHLDPVKEPLTPVTLVKVVLLK